MRKKKGEITMFWGIANLIVASIIVLFGVGVLEAVQYLLFGEDK